MITIISAGLGGLILARILHGISAEIYDTDASATSCHQGGGATRVLDKSGAAWLDEVGTGERPDVERVALRDLLVASLPPTMIHSGSACCACAHSRAEALKFRLPTAVS